jgi:hypothetical protein
VRLRRRGRSSGNAVHVAQVDLLQVAARLRRAIESLVRHREARVRRRAWDALLSIDAILGCALLRKMGRPRM